jgi:hypothetical protein
MGIQLEILPSIPASSLGDFAEDSANHSGLNYAYFGGNINGDVFLSGTVLLVASELNYIEVDLMGSVTANIVGFTDGRIPLATALTDSSNIIEVENRRSWLVGIRGGGTGGGGGGGGSTFTHVQSIASTSWTINHNLGTFPSVTVVDDMGNVIIADVTYVDDNTITISFSAASTGVVYLNSAGDNGFTHVQAVPATTWNISHGLNRFPMVTTVDNLGDVMFGDVLFVDSNTIAIVFSSAVTGVAYLN